MWRIQAGLCMGGWGAIRIGVRPWFVGAYRVASVVSEPAPLAPLERSVFVA